MKSLAAIAVGLVAGIAATAVARGVPSAPSFVVQSDERIGGFAVKTNGTLAGAIRAFGEPDSRQPLRRDLHSNVAITRTDHHLLQPWRHEPSPRSGKFSRAIMRGDRWRTTKGLRVGMLSTRVRRFYPKATWHRGSRGFWPSGWWLVTRGSLFGPSKSSYPGLLAETRNARVFSLQVRFPAGGD